MLSPPRDDDDDRHLCIKCSATIDGLENYIKHRRTCGKRVYDRVEVRPPKTLESIDPLEPSCSQGADVFFQSLELQSSVKKSSARLSPPPPPPVSVKTCVAEKPPQSGGGWIGGHTLRLTNDDDNHARLIDAVHNISGEKHPPAAHTAHPAHTLYCDDKEDEEEEDDDDSDEEVETPDAPPPHHTGGKWRPASPVWSSAPAAVLHDDAPPPGHTRGKWLPGASITAGSLHGHLYWCGACHRGLGSETLYRRHLQTALHRRKVLPEEDLEYSGHLERRGEDKGGERAPRPSRVVQNTVRSLRVRKVTGRLGKKKKRQRRRQFVHCAGCQSRVRTHLMGKHLISHYHFRKVSDVRSASHRQLILDNIEAIVRQAPYQCGPCKFYFNRAGGLLRHWAGAEHTRTAGEGEGRYWCSFCKFECDTSDDMLLHLSGAPHRELSAAVSRSVPIVIRRRVVLSCPQCARQFRYNVQLRQHSADTGHALPHTATDVYQEIHSCTLCDDKFKSSLTLASHLKVVHKQKSYLCLVCSLTFPSARDATSHRNTSEHRVRQKLKLKERGELTQDLKKKCPYCMDRVELDNILELKEHIKTVHPNSKKKCPKCGMTFILPQEVTRHVRSAACDFSKVYDPDVLQSNILWKCRQCLFQTDSQAECFFHEVLHTKPHWVKKPGSQKIIERYICPLCPHSFTKPSLRLHIRKHTLEKPAVCTFCAAKFTRQSSLTAHLQLEHGKVANSTTRVTDNTNDEDRHSTLDGATSHQTSIKEIACTHPQCSYLAKTPQQLTRHRRSHNERIMRHQCPHCHFKCEQASHMKRHLVTHEGVKPYGCPHCDFTCASLENLRKHARRSTKHADRPLYRCTHCGQQMSLASLYKKHLVDEHRYHDKDAARASKVHLLRWTTPHNKVGGGTSHLLEDSHSTLDGATSHLTSIKEIACTHPQCTYLAKTPQQLSRHRRSHNERIMRHQCPHCYFKCEQASHMKRHLATHEGVKPYGCPHCDFTCASLENLRKHARRSTKHADRPLYRCTHCGQQMSLASLYKKHLVDEHRYHDKDAARASKVHLLRWTTPHNKVGGGTSHLL